MSKKKHKKHGEEESVGQGFASSPRDSLANKGISKTGKKVIGLGIGLLIIGFFVLSRTDPAGQNWASVVSPFLLVAGYITIAIGIIIPSQQKSTNP